MEALTLILAASNLAGFDWVLRCFVNVMLLEQI